MANAVPDRIVSHITIRIDGERMNPELLKQTITALASQMKANPAQLKEQIAQLRGVLPHVTEDQIKALVSKASTPGFDARAIAGDIEAMLKR